ncbi:GNAT family N-acetyltransferase [Aliiglaciecola lipolytica]|uniref:N-acetyltransferase domain-containing protein n=1 Tax=Aliiglaciecola lipolytica E3 TaxID=1127673 RepID=K6XRU4_9ALTE|nr:GNAT family N-acetyltransferase [Aliiglaciecola lipolytica]GAC14391.1 hypothetical protein GLIP_1758 [Aliiglaciecola lipolytica E3]
MQLSAVEIFGYCASALIAFSLTRDSIVRLRWYNLFGASSFCVYGIIIGAAPVALLNGFIAITNIVYLRKMLLQAEQHFSVLEVSLPSNYVDFFLDYHRQDVHSHFPRFFKNIRQENRRFYFMMENTEVVGLLSGYPDENNHFIVDFDFVIPAYRDCRLGQFVLGEGQRLKTQYGYSDVFAKADSIEHENYLHQLGYSPDKNGIWSYSE